MGTKDSIECMSRSHVSALVFTGPAAYFNELERSLEYVRETPDLSLDEKKRFFKSANTNLGINHHCSAGCPDVMLALGVTALCLSGGGTLGYCELLVYGSTPY